MNTLTEKRRTDRVTLAIHFGAKQFRFILERERRNVGDSLHELENQRDHRCSPSALVRTRSHDRERVTVRHRMASHRDASERYVEALRCMVMDARGEEVDPLEGQTAI